MDLLIFRPEKEKYERKTTHFANPLSDMKILSQAEEAKNKQLKKGVKFDRKLIKIQTQKEEDKFVQNAHRFKDIVSYPLIFIEFDVIEAWSQNNEGG